MSTSDTTETLVGVFATRAQAQKAITELYDAGFSDIGFVAKDPGDRGSQGATDNTAEEALAAGAMTGAAAGALSGAAIGTAIAVGAIPVIGPVLAIGTLGTVLLNAAGGAAAASIAGALISWGIAEEDARYYENEVSRGRFLVTVEAHDRLTAAQEIMMRHGATSARRDWKGQPIAV